MIESMKLLWKFIVENKGDSNFFIESKTEKNAQKSYGKSNKQ